MKKDLFYLSDTDFPIAIIEHDKKDKGVMFEAHSHHNQLQLFFIFQGQCQIFCNHIVYSMNANDLLIIPPQELHYGNTLSVPLHYYVIRINLELLATLSSKVCRDKYILPILQGLLSFHHFITSESIKEMCIEAIQVSVKKELGYELILMEFIYRFLALLMQENTVYLTTDMNTEYLMKKRQRFEFLFSYIKEHLAENLSISLLAEKSNMSVAYFCRYFKECTAETPVNYINKLRLEKAITLLNQGSFSITEIAYACGFHDSNYFSRVFRKYMKQTPSNFLACSRKFRI